MAQEIGLQYKKDNVDDSSGFLARARLHKSRYRAEVLDIKCDKYGNCLLKSDAWDGGLNFYDDFEVIDAVKERYPKYSKGLYGNATRKMTTPDDRKLSTLGG